MKLISRKAKKIMEECKVRARDVGLTFEDDTLEYIVTNRDMIDLSPKVMIPTLYDYWVQDVQVFQDRAKYKVFPSNPYETVINSRPAMSFYNDNNPDWLNVMIFYHVLAHIDFFQNNQMFQNTWDDDFVGKALADKRLISSLRKEHFHLVDYIIEFSKGIDNIVGYFPTLAEMNSPKSLKLPKRLDFYFGDFLQKTKGIRQSEYLEELERYNRLIRDGTHSDSVAETLFFSEVKMKFPEFDALFEKKREERRVPKDLMQYIMKNSQYLQREDNQWMRSVMQIIRDTALYFKPQGRTKIMNEGWASYWHEELFMTDERVRGHEVDFAVVNAKVTSLPRIGVNPYAIGLRLFRNIKRIGDKGRDCWDFDKIQDIEERKRYDTKAGKGNELIFNVRKNLNDFLFINKYVDQEFVDRHKLFVVGREIDYFEQIERYYVKSRKAEDYKQMILDMLDHPPVIDVNESKTNKTLYLVHKFEGKNLHKKYIHNTMMGIEFLWGGPIVLETTEKSQPHPEAEPEYTRVKYTMKRRELKRTKIG